MKILLLDIENAPPGWFAFKSRRQYLGAKQQREKGQIICAGAKWLGKPGFIFNSILNPGDGQMITNTWELLDEADAVIHYYGRRHDIPHLNREFWKLGLGPPSPYKQIDLYYVVKQNFALDFYSLDYVAKTFGIKGKRDSGGLDALLACRDGDPDAWRKIERYNKQDVVLLEQLYWALRPWIRSHPSHGALLGADMCPKCGSGKLERRGFHCTQSGKYQRYRCTNCGSWSRDSKRLDGTGIVEAA